MNVITDGLLITAAIFAGLYCRVLAVRVQALKSLDSGLGAAIVTLTRHIELARATLEEARAAARDTRHDLVHLAARADAAAAQLRLLLAAVERTEPAPALTEPAPEPSQAAPMPAAHTPAAPTPFEAALAARRREAAGPRLVSPAPDPWPRAEAGPEPRPERREATGETGGETPAEAAPPALDPADAVPKPRRTLSLDGLARRRPPLDGPATRDEAALIAALSAIASGGER